MKKQNVIALIIWSLLIIVPVTIGMIRAKTSHTPPMTREQAATMRRVLYYIDTATYMNEVRRIHSMSDSMLVVYLRKHVDIDQVNSTEPKYVPCNCILDDDK